MTETYETISLNVEAPFATITLNRPEVRNALNFTMMGELLSAFEALGARDDVRAIILTGAGGNFCSGGDLSELQAETTETAQYSRMDTLLTRIIHSPKVVIAKVEGAALGGGMGLVCAADIAIASTTASFGLPEARFGFAPAIIAPYVIQRVGLTRTRMLMLTAVRFDGVSAHEYGIVQEVCPAEILDDCTNAILVELRACSTEALAACKQIIFSVVERTAAQSLSQRLQILDTLRHSADFAEGRRAIAEQRPPDWSQQ